MLRFQQNPNPCDSRGMGHQDRSDDCYLRVASHYTAPGYLIALTETSPSKENVLTFFFRKRTTMKNFMKNPPTLHWRLASNFSWSKDSHLELGGSSWQLSFFTSFSSMSPRKRCSGYLNYVTPGCDLWSTGTRCRYTAALPAGPPSSLFSTQPPSFLLAYSILSPTQKKLCWLRSLSFTCHPSKPSTPSKISSKNVLPSSHSLLSFCVRMTHDEIHPYTLPVMQPRGKLLWPLWHLFSTAIILKAIMLPWKID